MELSGSRRRRTPADFRAAMALQIRLAKQANGYIPEGAEEYINRCNEAPAVFSQTALGPMNVIELQNADVYSQRKEHNLGMVAISKFENIG